MLKLCYRQDRLKKKKNVEMEERGLIRYHYDRGQFGIQLRNKKI